MKEYILTNQEARAVDRYAIDILGIPGIELMHRAGSYVSLKSKKLLKHVPGSQVDIFCGTGNNGGDGFVAAQDLANWGARVYVWIIGNPAKIKGDARHYYEKCTSKRITITGVTDSQTLPDKKQLLHSDLIIDALLGTGFTGEVRGIFRDIIMRINELSCPVLAVDIPSGINGDNAQVGGVAIRATRTITMGFLKRGLLFQPGKRYAGDIALVDLEYPQESYSVLKNKTYLIDNRIVENVFPIIDSDTYKHRQGKVLICASSPGMTGAAFLTSQAALRSGAGLVVNAIPESLNPIIEMKSTETLSVPVPESKRHTFCSDSIAAINERIDWSDVVVFGPGVSAADEVKEFGIALVKKIQKPLLIDADGLRIFQNNLNLIRSINDLILTPHVGEFSMITGLTVAEIKENIIDVAREFTSQYPCTLVLKGAPTVVAGRGGDVAVNSTGNPALATGGTGDVLTGLLAGLRVQKINSCDAAIAAVYIHGMAGDLGAKELGIRGLIAGDLLNYIPTILQKFEQVR